MIGAAVARAVFGTALLAVAATAGTAAETAPGLYIARTYVTGQGIENRTAGFAAAFREVLAKVSGDASLLDDPAVADMAGNAGEYVDDFSYRDRMADIPVHDEQGTRDRPFELTVAFAPDAIDGALAALGRKPWAGQRSTVAIVLAVDHLDLHYPLTRDGAHGREARAALADAAERSGLTIVLPASGAAVAGAVAEPTAAAALARALGAPVSLSGALAWSDADLGWNADWRFDGAGPAQTWQARGVSLGEAARSGLQGAASILSRHGTAD